MFPALVITAFNRPAALQQLLGSLARAAYPSGGAVPLVISIDYQASPAHAAVQRLAEDFAWPHGPKTVVAHPQPLGLVRHFFWCGDLTTQYPAVILLEDDLFVAPVFYFYAQQALAFYAEDEHIGGVSLYPPWFNGYTHLPFIPLADAADAFFLQMPFFHGQAWTRAQWQALRQWHASAPPLAPTTALHDFFLRFPADDWFPHLVQHAVETRRFYPHPRVALVTNFGPPGAHFAQPTAFLQAPLQREKTRFTFHPLAISNCVYDSFFELRPDRLNRLTPILRDFDYLLDVNGTRAPRHLTATHVLTLRPLQKDTSVARAFGLQLFPPEANVIEALPGQVLQLCHPAGLRWDGAANRQLAQRASDYFQRGRYPPLRRWLRAKWQQWGQKIGPRVKP